MSRFYNQKLLESSKKKFWRNIIFFKLYYHYIQIAMFRLLRSHLENSQETWNSLLIDLISNVTFYKMKWTWIIYIFKTLHTQKGDACSSVGF